LGSKHTLLKEGIGWGNMPLPMVESDLAAGRLVRLDLPDVRGGVYSLEAIYRAATPPGPAATWLIERFKSQVSLPAVRGKSNSRQPKAVASSKAKRKSKQS
jgi:DNA-binding transcriptional LysR family regulator